MSAARPAGTPSPAGRPWPKVGLLRRWGPVTVVVALLVLAGVLATVQERSKTATSGSPSSPAARSIAHTPVPPNYAVAEREGKTADYEWSPRCDRATGRLKVPSIYAPPCVPVWRGGDNGGATWNGVGGRTINVVYYQAPPGDLTAAVQGAAGTPQANFATAQKYVDMFNKIVELYGRRVRLIEFNATGVSTDAVAAHADAVTVATRLDAFASINGPAQTSAYADELARLHVLCISCGLADTYSGYRKDAPYLWGSLPTPDSLLNTAWSYIIRKLNGHDAIWAGEPAFRHRRRLFAVVHYEQNPPVYGSITRELTRRFEQAHVNALRQSFSYLLDLSTLQDQADTIAAKLKASGATTVVFAGDPIMPIYLTRACAKIGYFPEWVITGTVFTDTSTLARYYDQKEWAHAFGISSLPVPTPIQSGDAFRLYRWWYGAGRIPPAPGTAAVVLPLIELLFDGIELAGPHLTPYSFSSGVFASPPAGGGPTTPLAAYGYQGARPWPSYTTPADYTYIWYDAKAKGPDEEGVYGTGLMRYVDGGRRYPDYTTPAGNVPMFDPSHAPTTYRVPPASGRPPDYPPWPGSPAAAG